MATKIDNLSYTNKDFNAIFNELLAMGDEISAKWKPSATNESDPGIVLIKENAVIGDKLDYNIDKNILEAFPSSVTQEGIARQLFEEQLACPAQWYRAASGIVNFRYIINGQETEAFLNSQARIPMYTIVQNSEATISYTIVDYDKTIKFDGTYDDYGYNVLQGIPNTYTIGTNDVVSINNLDENRRLYFREYNVAQNGIFVSTTLNNTDFWKVVELLSVQPYGEKVVKFGVDKNNRCYLEFPTWIDDIIEDGLHITYITTDGSNGGIASGQLVQFGEDITLTPIVNDEELDTITLNSENILMQNPYAINNGKDPDTIDEMFDRWKKVAGTFNTLVTINDYDSAIPRDIVGNGFACDRNSDIQTSYNVIHTIENQNKKLHERETRNGGESIEVSPYDIKLYLTQLPKSIQNIEDYKNSFKFVDNFGEETFSDGETFEAKKDTIVDDVIESFEEDKCISQDFANVKRYKLLFFKNKYPINCTIIPTGRLSDKELSDIKRNVVLALYDRFNGSKMHFGEEVNYDEVYDVIKNADNRIASIHLQDITYNTYAVYRGSDYDTTDDYIEVPVNQFYQNMLEGSTEEGELCVVKGTPSPSQYLNGDYITGTLSDDDSINEYVWIDNNNVFDKYYGFVHFGTSDILKTINAYMGTTSSLQSGDSIYYNYPFGTEFAADVYAKSVLNGNTPFTKKDTAFARSIAQKVNRTEDAYYIKTESQIAPSYSNNFYTIQANENIQIFSPSYRDKFTCAYGSKMQYVITNDIDANTDHRLQSGEKILLFWRENSNEDYQWAYYAGDGSSSSPIINSTIKLEASRSAHYDTNGFNRTSNFTEEINMSSDNNAYCGLWLGDILGIPSGVTTFRGTTSSIDIRYTDANANPKYPIFRLSKVYNAYDGTTQVVDIKTATQMLEKLFILSYDSVGINDKIVEKDIVEVELGNGFLYFWVLNSFEIDPSYSSGYKSVLFEQDERTRYLDNGEYLFYTNREGSALYQLGAGTKITRNWDEEWACDRVDLIDYVQQTPEERSKYWETLSGTNKIVAQEQTITAFGEGAEVMITPALSQSALNGTFQSLVDGTKVEYKTAEDNNYKALYFDSNAQIRTALQLVCGPNTPQELKWESYGYGNISCQTITLYDENGMQIGSEINPISGDKYVMTSRDCEYSGNFINVQTIDATNKRSPLQFYSYDNAGGTYSVNNFNGVNVTVPVGSTIKLTTAMQSGNYLLPFKYNSEGTVGVRMSFDDVTYVDLEDITGEGVTTAGKQYYLEVNVPQSGDVYITFTSNSSIVYCETGELIKYTMPKSLEGDAGDGRSAEWHIVLMRMKELDQNNDFDYGYIVNTNDLIENPLEAFQFNNPNHVMNKYTICEMDIDAMGENMNAIKVLNSAR